MFQSATVKLTAWYAGILMIISILFSVAIYQISLDEVNTRIAHFQGILTQREEAQSSQTAPPPLDANGRLRGEENSEAASALLIRLVYINVVVLVVGSLASYLLARRTLRPVQNAHEAQARFVSDTSHELRTPLAVMKSELEVSLRDKELSKQGLRTVLASNLEEVESLSRMTEMLLAMARMDHKKLEKQPLDLKLVAGEALYRFKLPQKRLNLTGQSVKVLGNETSLIEMMTILIDNALKYSPRSSTVELQVGTNNNQAFFAVSNTGKGIKPDELDHIFDRFYRADMSRTNSEQKGFGLGLSIAMQIAQLHNAEITASSAPDAVTEFRYLQQKIS